MVRERQPTARTTNVSRNRIYLLLSEIIRRVCVLG